MAMKGHVYETFLLVLFVCNIKFEALSCVQGEPKIGKKSSKFDSESPTFHFNIFSFEVLIRIFFILLPIDT